MQALCLVLYPNYIVEARTVSLALYCLALPCLILSYSVYFLVWGCCFCYFSLTQKKSTYSTHETIELSGTPMRFTVPRHCSNRAVHASVRQALTRFVRDESLLQQQLQQPPVMATGDSTANCNDCTASNTTASEAAVAAAGDGDAAAAPAFKLPYELVVTNTYPANVKRVIEDSEDAFQAPKGGSEMLIVLWRAAKIDELVDIDQVAAMRTAPPRSDIDEMGSLGGGALTVYKCLEKFIEREQLADSETLYCSKCKQHLAPIKKMDLWAVPDILIVHLKRFQYISGMYSFVSREKINDLVDFPVHGLDLTRYVIGPQDPEAPPIYDLYAVSHHSGGLGGGHYTATCQNPVNNKW